MQLDELERSAEMENDGKPLERFHRRVAETAADRSARGVTVVALGDSVTQGVAEVDRFLHGQVYHARLKALLEQSYPLTTFNVINAGVDGHCASQGLLRFERDVAMYRPDLVLVAFGLNDAVGGGFEGASEFGRTLGKLADRVAEEALADLIVLTPNMMLTRHNDAVPDIYLGYEAPFMAVQNEGVLAEYARQARVTSASRNVPVADVYRAWESLASGGVDTTAMLANGLNHPNAKGHDLAGREIFSVIQDHQPAVIQS